MTLYLVIQEAIYRHRLAGVFTTEARARQVAEEAIRAERDDHHRYEVSRCQLDVPCLDPEVVARVTRDRTGETLIWRDGPA